MEYKILNVAQEDDTIKTTVEMTLSDRIETVDIAHFRPQSVTDINQNIVDRLLTEQSKIDAVKIASSISSEIAIGETITIR